MSVEVQLRSRYAEDAQSVTRDALTVLTVVPSVGSTQVRVCSVGSSGSCRGYSRTVRCVHLGYGYTAIRYRPLTVIRVLDDNSSGYNETSIL